MIMKLDLIIMTDSHKLWNKLKLSLKLVAPLYFLDHDHETGLHFRLSNSVYDLSLRSQ